MCARTVAAACFSSLVLLLAVLPANAQTTWYVDGANCQDPGSGTPEDPFCLIQDGIDASIDGDTVLVRDWTYTGDGNRNLDFGGREILLQSENGPENCVIDCQNDGHGFYFHSNETENSILRGFTIQGAEDYDRGGIVCEYSSPTIENNIIRDNVNLGSGGGIRCFNSNPDILNNIISGNLGDFGGGIYCDSSSPNIVDNDIFDNTAHFGGGICCSNSSPDIFSNTITGNHAWNSNSQGGGICCLWSSSPAIAYNEISSNRAGSHSASSGEGGGIYCGSDSSPQIVNNLIMSNEALCTNIDERFSFDGYGGGILCAENSSPSIVNNFIAFNELVGDFDSRRTHDGYGAGIACKASSSPTIMNNTIVNNRGDDLSGGNIFGGGIYCDSSSAEIENCLVWGNSPNEIVGCDGLVAFSDIEGGYTGTGNIDEDPLVLMGPDGCYYLSHVDTWQPADSPCVNAGSAPASEISFTGLNGTIFMDELTTRIDGISDTGTVDIGYHHGGGMIIPCPPTISANLTCEPAAATVPFQTAMSMSLTNLNTVQTRRFAGQIHAVIASGTTFSNWKSGWLNVGAGAGHVNTWSMTIPAVTSVIGDNVFTLVTEDVTPSPYNQPPNQPSGDMDTDSCVVTGIAP